MSKRLVISVIMLATISNTTFAKNNKPNPPISATCPKNHSFIAGSYLGISAGSLINTTGAPTAYQGLQGSLSAGWGTMMTPTVYLGAEVVAQNSANIHDYKSDHGGVKSSWGYAINVLPGYMITDHVLGYLRLGGARTHFNDSSTFGSQNLSGWQVGIGSQTNLYKNWGMRAEYIYTGYNTLHGRGNVQSNLFNLGLVYKFI